MAALALAFGHVEMDLGITVPPGKGELQSQAAARERRAARPGPVRPVAPTRRAGPHRAAPLSGDALSCQGLRPAYADSEPHCPSPQRPRPPSREGHVAFPRLEAAPAAQTLRAGRPGPSLGGAGRTEPSAPGRCPLPDAGRGRGERHAPPSAARPAHGFSRKPWVTCPLRGRRGQGERKNVEAGVTWPHVPLATQILGPKGQREYEKVHGGI